MRKKTTCHAEYIEATSPESVEFTVEYLGEKNTVFISSQSASLYKSEEALVSTIFLACLMNNMNCTSSGALRYNGQLGVFQAIIPFEPGQYRYRVVIDGRWQADPYNPDRHVNEYGEINSILIVPARQGPS